MAWQVQEAKQKFSEVIRRAITEGPQVVTRHGETVAVVLSADEYRRLGGEKPRLIDLLLSGPDFGEIDLDRPREYPREPDL